MEKEEAKPFKSGNYKVDAFNRNPYFLISNDSKSKKAILVKSFKEALSTIKSQSIKDINPAFLASFIQRNPTTKSPFKSIKRISPSTEFTLSKSGEVFFKKYNPFISNYKKMSESELNEVIKQSVLSKINMKIENNKDNFLGVEHSSGIDSNIILGSIVKKLNIDPSLIFTFTNLSSEDEELINDFRKFYKLDLTHCIESKRETNFDILSLVDPLHEKVLINILGHPSQRFAFMNSINSLSRIGCKKIFSGLGGDQGISHSGLNVVYEMITNKRYFDLFNWSESPNIFVKMILRHIFFNIYKSTNYQFMPIRKSKYHNGGILIQSLKSEYFKLLSPHFSKMEKWETNKNIPLNESLIKRITNEWILVRMEEESKFAKYNKSEMIYPFIDEKIISLLINQDPLFFCSSIRETRLIARKSFSEFLPKFLKNNATKDRSTKNFKYKKESAIALIEELLVTIKNYNNEILYFFNISSLLNKIDKELSKKTNNINNLIEIQLSLATLIKLCIWGDELNN